MQYIKLDIVYLTMLTKASLSLVLYDHVLIRLFSSREGPRGQNFIKLEGKGTSRKTVAKGKQKKQRTSTRSKPTSRPPKGTQRAGELMGHFRIRVFLAGKLLSVLFQSHLC